MGSGKLLDIKTGQEKIVYEGDRGLIAKDNKWCGHRGVIVDKHTREVRCQECDALIDPFDFMSESAQRETNAFTVEKSIRDSISKLSDEHDALKSKVSYLKSQVKKLEKCTPQISQKSL